ncbi:MAG: hypothetical protein GEU98_13955 [Pseudonocardiaceae bacterium]|nr:hypothetical protein [Pseudonocardiaceae bacterium]
MLDEQDPLFRAAMAPFEENIAAYRAAAERIDEEYQQKAAEFQQHVENRDKELAETVERAITEAREQQEQGTEQSPAGQTPDNPWMASRQEQSKHYSFDAGDDRGAQPAAAGAPTPPLGFAVAPLPGAVLAPEPGPPVPQPAGPVFSFGADAEDIEQPEGVEEADEIDEQAATPPPRPAPRRVARPVAPDDDDDFSNQSWLR